MKINEDKLAKAVRSRVAARPRGSCPDEAELAMFIDGGLGEDRQAAMLSHLARCPSCREVVQVTCLIKDESEEESRVRIPLRALDRAASLDPFRKGMMEVAVSFAQGVAKVLRLSGGEIDTSAAGIEPIRGESAVVSETLISLTRQFPPFLAEIDLEKIKQDAGEITIKITDQDSGEAPEGVRVSLFMDDREIESSPLEDGQAVFENVKFGHYRVEITKVGAPLGRIALEMKGD